MLAKFTLLMKSIKQLKNIHGKRVLVRVDFNVPMGKNLPAGRQVLDTFRIDKTMPTIKYLIKKGAKVILISHLDKESGKSLKPVAEYISKYSKDSKLSRIKFITKITEEEIKNVVEKMKDGEVVLLENLRFDPGEEKNDMKFARKLAELGDLYVNDAFSVSHRKHASIVSLPKLLPAYAGFQLEEEVKNLSIVFKKPKRPFLFILGGAKFETKIPLMKKFLNIADVIFVGGALMNNFFKVKGYEIGKSLVDDSKGIKEILKNKKLILPIDVLIKSGSKLINRKINEIKKSETILDIGKESIKIIESYIKKFKLILWNGPLGKYEDKGDIATKKILKLVLKSKSQVVIGGGDIVTVLSKLELRNYRLEPNVFVSTGGGAMLEFLAKGTLPGIEVLG